MKWQSQSGPGFTYKLILVVHVLLSAICFLLILFVQWLQSIQRQETGSDEKYVVFS